MEVGIYGKKIQFNPELEALRDKGLQENSENTNESILQLIHKTLRIHAGFLFEKAYHQTLQDLCVLLSATQNKISDQGWMTFGSRLGLSVPKLQCINNHFHNQDPTFNTLLAYVQYEHATIGKIIQALNQMKRYDIITCIKDAINDLADLILQDLDNGDSSQSLEDPSDYGSLLTDGRLNSYESAISQGIIKPKVIPEAPFIFQNILRNSPPSQNSQADSVTSNCSESFSTYEHSSASNEGAYVEAVRVDENSGRTCDQFQKSEFKDVKKEATKAEDKRYGKIIMLTFAKDGEKIANEVCQILRKDRPNFPKMGVLVLKEHLDHVNKDPIRFISGSFQQVDYVCPILTHEYFDIISRKKTTRTTSNMHVDSHYAQYIYTLMNSYYVSNGCLNDKVRCVIPDELVSSIQCHLLMAAPLFASWVKMSEVDELAVRLLKSKSNVNVK